MKSGTVENVISDNRTCVVVADRVRTDGEVYRAIRLELLRRGQPLPSGERLIIPCKP